MEVVLFDALALLILPAAVLVIACRKVVHGALALGVVSSGVAALLGLLRAEFLALGHLLIYAGGAVSLFLLAGAALNLEERQDRRRRWPAIGVGAVVAGELIACAWRAGGEWAGSAPEGDAASVGGMLFDPFLLPLEILSLILVISLAGSIALARREERAEGEAEARRD